LDRAHDEVDHREEQREQEDRAQVGFEIRIQVPGEPIGDLLLAPEHLHDADALQNLLQVAVHARETCAHGAVSAARAAAEHEAHADEERRAAQHDEREPPVQPEQEREAPDDLHEVEHEHDQARREHLVQVLDVARDARDERAGRPLVEEREVEALHVPEQARAQVGDHHLSGLVELRHLEVAERDREHDQADVDRHPAPELAHERRDVGARILPARVVGRAHGAVERVAPRPRAEELEAEQYCEHAEAREEEPRVRARVHRQPAQDRAVPRLRRHEVVVEIGLLRARRARRLAALFLHSTESSLCAC
jgi:hypothetical protein